jgi:hypothetical protein
MRQIAFIIMSFAAITTRGFNIPRRISSSLFHSRQLCTDATKFNTADLQGKLYPPVSDGVDLISIGIGR